MKTLYWIAIPTVLVVATVVVINISFNVWENTNAPPPEAPAEAVEPPTSGPSEETCDRVQAKIDAEGQPGWEGLSEGLKAEIEALEGRCTLIGNERGF